MEHNRKLTVSYTTQHSPLYNSYYPSEHAPKSVPKVVMSGAWLREAGFDIGDKVQVKVEEGRIVLERVIE